MLKGKRTYIALAVALIGAALQGAGVEAEAGDVDLVGDGIVTIGGVVAGWFFRWRATVNAKKEIAAAEARGFVNQPARAAAERIGLVERVP